MLVKEYNNYIRIMSTYNGGVLFMINIFIGFIFVFFKTNLSFLDVGMTYYITNLIGYVSIYVGVQELEKTNQRLLKLKPYVIVMMAHSIIFFLLNITGHSPLTMGMSTPLETFIAWSGAILIFAGMFMIFIIIFELMDGLTGKNKLSYNLVSIMMFLFILACISAILNFSSMFSTTIMVALLLVEVIFLISYYYVFLARNEKQS
ncbi:hypothetical protein [Alkalibacillus almallahensis]|uniref:hypothetical protein n=1 Tax=Alkalibacillus almallahensis TaxID=1379154 RepID=UPI001420A374|nr:hypothetical protein [Alkalibacillus almallahensis]NIK12571.1 hypothetical protein [Alkalibacillus almallahensis]